MPVDAKEYIQELGRMRFGMVNSMRQNNAWEGFRRTLSDLYPDQAHFIYELLQNAEDAEATSVEFKLTRDKLVFTHNGTRQFTEADIESITNIGHSTKRSEVNQIGKFGVGFKAVFGYTATPRICSGEFSFEITDLFVPSWLNMQSAVGGETLFEFPFNSGKAPQKCVAEVTAWLREMNDNVLLFLRNIRRIRWNLDEDRWAELDRHERADGVVEIRRRGGHGVSSAKSFWLRFVEPVKPSSPLFVAIAFRLGTAGERPVKADAPTPLAEQMKVLPTDGQLSIYFPAQKEDTRLRFHLHGPYASTVDRASIPVGHAGNNELLTATARLLSSSMTKLKEMGLLTADCLEVLPNSSDNLAPFYQPLLTALVHAFKTDALVPTDDGGHAPARVVFKAPLIIRSLLNAPDLSILSGKPAAHWVAGTMQNQRADKFLDALEIANWSWPELHATMQNRFSGPGDSRVSAWLAGKDDAWIQGFYAVLKQMLEEEDLHGSHHGGWRSNEDQLQVQAWKIVRRSDELHVSGTTVHFPDKGSALPEFPLIKASLLEGKKPKQVEGAKQFLVAAGVRPVEERDRIALVLRRHYSSGATTPEWNAHIEHLRWFIRWWNENNQDASLFQDAEIFFGTGAVRLKPADAYIDSPLVDTGLSALFAANIRSIRKRCPLRADYANANIPNFSDFASKCGAVLRLEFRKSSTQGNPNRYELQSGGGRRTSYETDNDYTLQDLGALLLAKDAGISLLIWRTMCSAPTEVLRARYCPNYQAAYRYSDSQLVCKLRDSAWIPDQTGDFKKPSESRRETLSEEFMFDDRNGWLTAIGFESKRKQDSVAVQEKRKVAAALGIPSEAVELLEQLPEAARKEALDVFVNELRRRKEHGENAGGEAADFVEQLAKSMDRPGRPVPESSLPANSAVSNPSQRRERTDEEIENARTDEPNMAERSRLVARRVWESKNPEVRASLSEWYGGRCQICDMTFRKRDGENYFEARYLVLRTMEGAAWLDRPGNVLCLCATCCAKLQHGSIDSPDDIVGQLRRLKLSREGSTQPLAVHISLCHEEVAIRFAEKHLLDLQQMLSADTKGPSSRTPAIAPSLLLPASPSASKTQPAPSSASPNNRPELVPCPQCSAKVRADNLARHLVKAHAGDSSKGHTPKSISVGSSSVRIRWS